MTKRYNRDEMRAYNEAFDAFEAYLNGAPQESNPYRRGTGRHAAWAEGWREVVDNHREEIALQAELERRRAERV
jgi:ribosome modulation factor